MSAEKETAEGLVSAIPMVTWVWVAFFSAWGGAVAYLQKIKRGHVQRVSLLELIGELFTAAFAGTMTYLAGAAMGVPEIMLAPMIGVAGHMGSKLILIAEGMLQDSMTKFARRRGWMPPEIKKHGDD